MTLRIRFLLAAAAALPLTSCYELGIPEPGVPVADMTPEDRANYVHIAGAGDLFEIQSSERALARARSSAVRQFAEAMIREHRASTAQLLAAARASGINPPPPMLLSPHAAMLADLQRASDRDFDRVYLRHQVRAHELALALHSNYAGAGDSAPLRAVAAATAPVISRHLDHLKAIR